MKKRRAGRILSRNASQRKALKRTMLVSLVKYGSIQTTLAKAKELRPFAEKLITVAKKTDNNKTNSLINVLRRLKKSVPLKTAKGIVELAKKYQNRQGGYLRIVKLPFRKSDVSKVAIVQWVEDIKKDSNIKKKEKIKKSKKNVIKKDRS